MYVNAANRKDICLKFMCTQLEKRYLQVCAQKAGLSVSHYLHEMMLQGYAAKPKVVPEDVRDALGQLMKIAALLDPFWRKRLDHEDFNALERAEAKEVIRQVQALIQQIKNLVP
jgi:Mobilization protein NikA